MYTKIQLYPENYDSSRNECPTQYFCLPEQYGGSTNLQKFQQLTSQQATFSTMPPPGCLRRALQTRLLEDMIRKVGSATNKWKVLVVDRESLRILAAALYVNELVNEGITVVEMLDMRREPLPRIPALYFLTPSAESVEQLSSESPSQYKEFHVFFTSRLPDFQMSVLRENAALLKRVKALVELDVAFLALESRVFSLGRPASSIPQIYSGDNEDEAKKELAVLSERLTEVCQIVAPALDWTVRSDATSTSARTVAALVKGQLDAARVQRKTNVAEDGGIEDRGEEEDNDDCRVKKATLLVVDRAADLVSPLVHEFSYQAMAHDLLALNYRKPGGVHVDISDEKDPEKKKSVQFDDEEKDPIWGQIRSLFVEEALQRAQAAFKEFLEKDAAFKIRGKGTGEIDIKDMSAAVRSLPNSQLYADKFAMHIKASRDCLDACRGDRLQDLALVEQNLITGRQPDGTKVRPEVMVEAITDMLEDDSIPISHRARLVMMALVIASGMPGMGGENSTLAYSASFRGRVIRTTFDSSVEGDPVSLSAVEGLKRVLDVAKAGLKNAQSQKNQLVEMEDTETVTGKLRQKYAHKQAKKQYLKESAVRRKRHGLEEEHALQYDVARFRPPLRSVMMDLVDDELDKEEFPASGTVSVDTIISSLGGTSVTSHSTSEVPIHKREKATLRFGVDHIRSHSASVAGMVKSLAKSDSTQSGASDDDVRIRLAERDHLYIVFVLGGICYSEVRAMYEVCTKREANVLLGGSHILTPNTMVEALGSVADPVLRIRVMLPPLPIELAMSRAARAKALEAGRAKQASTASPERKRDGVEGSDDPLAEKRDVSDVEVVVGYKKSCARRLFGLRKK